MSTSNSARMLANLVCQVAGGRSFALAARAALPPLLLLLLLLQPRLSLGQAEPTGSAREPPTLLPLFPEIPESLALQLRAKARPQGLRASESSPVLRELAGLSLLVGSSEELSPKAPVRRLSLGRQDWAATARRAAESETSGRRASTKQPASAKTDQRRLIVGKQNGPLAASASSPSLAILLETTSEPLAAARRPRRRRGRTTKPKSPKGLGSAGLEAPEAQGA